MSGIQEDTKQEEEGHITFLSSTSASLVRRKPTKKGNKILLINAIVCFLNTS